MAGEKIGIAFNKGEEDLYAKLKERYGGNLSRVLKDLAKQSLDSPNTSPSNAVTDEHDGSAKAAYVSSILDTTIGQDIRDYAGNHFGIPGEEYFIKVGLDKGDLEKNLAYRVNTLYTRHPDVADEVIKQWKIKYPKTGSLLK